MEPWEESEEVFCLTQVVAWFLPSTPHLMGLQMLQAIDFLHVVGAIRMTWLFFFLDLDMLRNII